MTKSRVAVLLTAVGILAAIVAIPPLRIFSWSVAPVATLKPYGDALAQCLTCEEPDARTNVGTSISQLAELTGVSVDRQKLQAHYGQNLPAKFSLRDIYNVVAPNGLKLLEWEVDETQSPGAVVPCLCADKSGAYVVASASEGLNEFLLWSPNGKVVRFPMDEFRRRFGARVLALDATPPAKPTSLVINSRYADLPIKGTAGEIRHFTVFNPWEAEVEVRSAASNCPCAEVSISPMLIPPKGAATLRVKTQTPVEEGIEFASWPVVLQVVASQPASLNFALHAKVERPVIVSPPAYHFEELAEGFETKKLVFTARIADPSRHVDLAPLYLDDGLRWGGSTAMKQASQAIIYLESSSLTTRPDREFSLHAILYDRKQPEQRWTLAVKGAVQRPLEFLPKEVFLGNVAPDEKVTRSVRLKNTSKVQPIAEISQPDRLAVTFHDNSVHLTFTTPEEVGAFRYHLFVHADGHPVSLPISGIVTVRNESREVSPTIMTESH